MLMLAPTYWVMVLARLIQGIGSAMIWTVGLALLCVVFPKESFVSQVVKQSWLLVGLMTFDFVNRCDTVPQKDVGRECHARCLLRPFSVFRIYAFDATNTSLAIGQLGLAMSGLSIG